MTRLLSLDPGIRGCGVALFTDGRLTACDYVKNPIKAGNVPDAVLAMTNAVCAWSTQTLYPASAVVDDFVFEHPRIYTIGKSKGDNNDLMPLVAVGYSVAVYFPHQTTRVYPHEWKGQTPKEVMHARIAGRLDLPEGQVWIAAERRGKSLFHNTADAVGIGLFHLGRLAPKKSWEP